MTRKNNSLLSYTEWSEAYDTFMMTYIQEQGLKRANDVHVCGLLKDMLTYRNHVTTMMKEGGEWRGYDQHFRKLMENQKVSWATANFNLIWHYNNKTLANHSSRTKFTRTNNITNRALFVNNSTPLTHGAWNYGHFCTRCGDNTHPYYLCQNRTDRATASTQLYRSARATGVSKYSSRINRGPTLMSKQTTIKDTVKNQWLQHEHSTVHATTPVRPDRLSIYLESTQYPQKLTESLVHGFTHGFELGHF